jgi:hypothetical protein
MNADTETGASDAQAIELALQKVQQEIGSTDKIQLGPFYFDLFTALVVVGQFKLASRTPGNVGLSAKTARDLADKLKGYMIKAGYHGMDTLFHEWGPKPS